MAANSSTGTQDFTTTDFGGGTPKGVILIGTYADADGVVHDDAGMVFGAADGTRERMITGNAEDGQASTDTARDQDSLIFQLSNPGGTAVNGAATFDSFITNGVRIDWSDVPTDQILITAILFGGSDFECRADHHRVGADDVLTDNTDPGFEPDAIIFFQIDNTWSAGSATGRFNIGMAVNDGLPTQISQEWHSSNNAGTSAVNMTLKKGFVSNLRDSNDVIEVVEFDANGFSTITRQGSPTNVDIGYFAMRFGGREVRLNGFDSPVATGNFSLDKIGSKPQFVMLLLSMMPEYNRTINTGDAGAFGISTFTKDAEFCNAFADEDAADTSNCQSVSDDQAITLHAHDGTLAFGGTFVSMDADGFTLNLPTTVDTTIRKWWCLSVGSAPAPRLVNGGLVQ